MGEHDRAFLDDKELPGEVASNRCLAPGIPVLASGRMVPQVSIDAAGLRRLQ